MVWQPYGENVAKIVSDLDFQRKLHHVEPILQDIEAAPLLPDEVILNFWAQFKAWPFRYDHDKYFNKKTGLPNWETPKYSPSCLLRACPSEHSTSTQVKLVGVQDSFVWCVPGVSCGYFGSACISASRPTTVIRVMQRIHSGCHVAQLVHGLVARMPHRFC